MKCALLLLLVACRGTDVKPDEFRVDVGHGETSGQTGLRDMDSESNWGSLGLTWYIGDEERREHERRYEEWLWAKEKAPAAIPSPEPAQPARTSSASPEAAAPVAAASQDSRHDDGDPTFWQRLVPLVPAMILALVGLVLKEKH